MPAVRDRIASRYGESPSDELPRTMLSVQEDFLAASFTSISEEFASLEHDAKAVLDLDDGRLANLRARLTGPGAFKKSE